MKKIIYIGDATPGSTSFHRASALQRLGHSVTLVDPYKKMGRHLSNPYLHMLHYRTGYRFLQKRMLCLVKAAVQPLAAHCDLVWVNSGELLGKKALSSLKSCNLPVILYNNDDPFGGRDGKRFDSLRLSIPQYDLCVVCREKNVSDYQRCGAKTVIRVWMSYDEEIHAPYMESHNIPSHFLSDVAFIGTWMRHEHRDVFLWELIEQGVPLSIWGDRWEKSPLWDKIKSFHRGGNIHNRDYVSAIQGSKLCIGLLSKGNSDRHTSRTMEIPYAGGLLCAERTPEHLYLYKEDEEAVFWDDSSECAEKCLDLLADSGKREKIRIAGMQKVRANKVGNEDICRQIMDTIFP